MKVVVIGLGSMGKRRIRLIKENFDNIEIVGIDFREDRRAEVEKLFNIATFDSIQGAINSGNVAAALVCTAPIHHGKIIVECLENNLHVFTEINLVKDEYDNIINLAKEKDLKLFLSSTMLYRNEINYIKEKVLQSKERLNYTYHVGQYLPDWHPWEDYKNFFVNDVRTNGCREIFAIELPWIIKTFGEIKSFHVMKDKISSLNLNYDDSYIVMMEHESGHKGVFNVDIVSRKAIRKFEVYGENLHIFWEGTPDSLKDYDLEKASLETIKTYEAINKDNRYAANIIENAYLEELNTFFNKIKGTNNERYTFEDDIYVLNFIDKIEGV